MNPQAPTSVPKKAYTQVVRVSWEIPVNTEIRNSAMVYKTTKTMLSVT